MAVAAFDLCFANSHLAASARMRGIDASVLSIKNNPKGVRTSVDAYQSVTLLYFKLLVCIHFFPQ